MIKQICKNCGKEFWVYYYRKNIAKFCSYQCKSNFQKGKQLWPNGRKFTKKHKENISKALKGKSSWNKGKKLPKEWKIKLSISHLGQKAWNKNKKLPQFSGKNHPNWKGGKYKNHNYIFIYKPDHPFATKQGYVFEHRLVMEKHLGRFLNLKEIIHHINSNPSDNRIKNLKLFKNFVYHLAYHRKIKN